MDTKSDVDNFGPADRKTLTEMVVRLEYLTKTVNELAAAVPQRVIVDQLRSDVIAIQAQVETLKAFRWQLVGGVLVLNALTALFAAKFIHP